MGLMITCTHFDCGALNQSNADYCARCGRTLHTGNPILAGNGHPALIATSPVESVPMARPVMPEYVPFVPSPPGDPILLPGLTRSEAWVDLVLAAVLVVGWDLVIGAVLHAWLYATGSAPLDGEWPPELQQRFLVPGLFLRASGIIGIVLLLVRRRGQPLASVGLSRRGWPADVLIGVTALFVLYAIMFLFLLVVAVAWPELMKQLQQNAELLQDLVPPLGWLGFIPLALVIGIYEELLFRGFLMTRLRKATGSWIAAVLLSTALFTVLHAADQTGAALLLILMLSIVFSIMTVWRRSILAAIIAHALFNYSQFLFLTMQQS